MQPMNPMKRTTVDLPREVYTQLKKQAKESGRSVASQTRMLLAAAVRRPLTEATK